MIRRLSHLCLMTNDLPRQIAFYQDKLGLTVQFRFVNANGEEFGVYLGCGDTTFVEIFDQTLAAKQWGGDLKPLHEGNRYNHFCLEVTGLDDLRKTLAQRGVEVGPISTGLDHSLQAWLRDPDENRIELMEFTHRSRQLQPPER
jgi:catechol 2,3-dioxygenase-like lactoylglutathione lyase family enzyme